MPHDVTLIAAVAAGLGLAHSRQRLHAGLIAYRELHDIFSLFSFRSCPGR
jgi:hypothetical protein